MDTHDVERMQMWEYAQAYIAQREPALSFEVDEVLGARRNDWLQDIHINVNANYEIFADSTRENRTRLDEGMQHLVEKWAAERPSFEQLLELELRAFFGRPEALRIAIQNRAAASDDPMAFFGACHNPILEEYRMLFTAFLHAGGLRQRWDRRCCASGIGIAEPRAQLQSAHFLVQERAGLSRIPRRN
jgi:hypothetical protein